MAGSQTNPILCIAFLCALTSASQAQRTAQPAAPRPGDTASQTAPKSTSSHLLTQDEGLAILGAALDARHLPQANGDCSHVVHAIYEQAGFRYRTLILRNSTMELRSFDESRIRNRAIWPYGAGTPRL